LLRGHAILTAACLATLAGCSLEHAPGAYPSSGEQLDYNGFVCNVMPTLVRRCSYLGCHGQADHALRVYSPGKLRLVDDGTRAGRDRALSADEVQRNFDSAAALALDATPAQRQSGDARHVLLLGKPLRARFGGGEHHGVGIFPVWPVAEPTKDPEWSALVAWVGGARVATPLSGDCATTFATLQLTPR
jgi:hypothetical protein